MENLNFSSSEDEVWEQVPDSEPKQQDDLIEISIKNQKRRGITKKERIKRIYLHHFHLLNLLSVAVQRNRLTRELMVQATILSLVPKELLEVDYQKIKELLNWWINFKNSSPDPTIWNHDLLEFCLEKTVSKEVSVLLFTSLCRALRIPTRLVCSLFPIRLSFKKYEPPNFPIRFWCEIFNGKSWDPVDPVKGTVGQDIITKEPHSYIVALEDGFGIRDVTTR